MYNKINRKK